MSHPHAEQFETQTFTATVLESAVPVLVDFWAPWCAPCRAIAPTIDALSEDLQGRAKVGKVNVDENPELSIRYAVQSIPTLMVFKGVRSSTRSSGPLRRRASWRPSRATSADAGRAAAYSGR